MEAWQGRKHKEGWLSATSAESTELLQTDEISKRPASLQDVHQNMEKCQSTHRSFPFTNLETVGIYSENALKHSQRSCWVLGF
jgi:hypothetical protein